MERTGQKFYANLSPLPILLYGKLENKAGEYKISILETLNSSLKKLIIATIWQILIFSRKSCLLTLSLFQCENKCILLSVSTILAQANRASLPRFVFGKNIIVCVTKGLCIWQSLCWPILRQIRGWATSAWTWAWTRAWTRTVTDAIPFNNSTERSVQKPRWKENCCLLSVTVN